MLSTSQGHSPDIAAILAGFGADAADGALLTRTKDGPTRMTFVPLEPGQYNTNVASNTGAVVAASITQNYSSTGSPGGLATSALMKTSTGGTAFSGGQCVLSFQFRGKYISLVCTTKYQNNTNPIQGWVDGQYFSVNNNPQNYKDPGTTANAGQYCYYMPIPVQLDDDGPHQIEIYNPFDPLNATQNQVQVYGYCLEARLGIPDFVPAGYTNVLTLPTSAGAHPDDSQSNPLGTGSGAFRVMKITFYCVGAASDTLNVKRDGNLVYDAVTVSKNTPLAMDFGPNGSIYNGGGSSSGANLIHANSVGGNIISYAEIRER